ncbi:PilN domain-containing protein [Rahnella sp. SL6]|jgi:pilus assembly protein HofN|uniref:PilN domain-containing protein n=1 Tax=Rahnella TaxID=34037 RepID=UPI00101EFD0F|nr:MULTISPECIES: PilN domain-containing protein [Rahnella]MBU9812299.1 PilN domain-containing protein [Rahnella perminowiae]UJD87527.1 fimbrial assembly protein [Rahnella aquatilis]
MLQVNLLPWRKLRRQKLMRFWLKIFISVPVSVVAGALLLATFLVQERALLQVKLSALHSDIQKITLRQRRVEAASEQVKVLAESRLLSHQRVQRSRDYLQLLVLLASEMPEELWLTELTEHQGMMTLKGEGRIYHDIVALSEMLSAGELLSKVSLSDVQQQPNNNLSFVMKTQFRPEKALPAPGVVQ